MPRQHDIQCDISNDFTKRGTEFVCFSVQGNSQKTKKQNKYGYIFCFKFGFITQLLTFSGPIPDEGPS